MFSERETALAPCQQMDPGLGLWGHLGIGRGPGPEPHASPPSVNSSVSQTGLLWKELWHSRRVPPTHCGRDTDKPRGGSGLGWVTVLDLGQWTHSP